MELICCPVFLNELNDMFNKKAIICATYTLTCLNIITIRQVQEEIKMISNDQELIQSDPTSCPQNQKGNN